MLSVFLHIINSFRPDKITPTWKKFAKQRKADIQVGSDILIAYPWKEFVFHIENRLDYISGTSRQLNFSVARTEIAANSDFSLLIEREGFFSAVSKLFGKREMKVDLADFDRTFYVRSNDEQLAKAILQNSICDLLRHFHVVRLQIGREPGYFEEQPPEGSIMIYTVLDYELKTVEELDKFEQLLKELVQQYLIYKRLLRANRTAFS